MYGYEQCNQLLPPNMKTINQGNPLRSRFLRISEFIMDNVNTNGHLQMNVFFLL